MKKRIGLLILSIVLVLAILGGSTYSLVFKVDETEQQSYNTGNLIISSNTNNSITLNNSLPMSDEDWESLTPYEFKVTNNGNVPFKFNIKLMSIDNISNMISPEYIKLKINDEEIMTLNKLVDGNIFKDALLVPGDSMDFSLRVWLSKDIRNNQIGKVFNAKITTEGYSVAVPSYVTLNNLGLIDSIKNDTPDFSKVSYSTCNKSTDNTCEKTVGIYFVEDDLGISYYFRGDVNNNHVKFGKDSSGKDMYWKIVRINGDGTIRMIYDGTRTEATRADEFAINPFSGLGENFYNDNAHVGYMRGLTGMTVGVDDINRCLEYDNNSSSIINSIETNSTKELCESAGGVWTTTAYEATHANVVDSSIKSYLEKQWYPNNFDTEEETQYIADAIYCNDRGLDIRANNNTGVGTNISLYVGGQRFGNEINGISPDNLPKLQCENPNDRFTLEKSNFNIQTNGKLDKPIGLITADELDFAGVVWNMAKNPNVYLYENINFWTMTPNWFNATQNGTIHAGMFIGASAGAIGNAASSHSALRVRPVISLKAGSLIYNNETSNGSLEHPFIVG